MGVSEKTYLRIAYAGTAAATIAMITAVVGIGVLFVT